MLDDKDIQKLIKAQEEVFVTKLDFENFREEYKKDFSNLLTAVDGYTQKADKYFQRSKNKQTMSQLIFCGKI